MTTHATLVRELKTLRKGRGVHAGRIVDRVGTALAAACGITRADGPAAVPGNSVTAPPVARGRWRLWCGLRRWRIAACQAMR